MYVTCFTLSQRLTHHDVTGDLNHSCRKEENVFDIFSNSEANASVLLKIYIVEMLLLLLVLNIRSRTNECMVSVTNSTNL